MSRYDDDRPAIRVLTRDGVQVVTGLSADDRADVARHWNAVRRYLETGDETGLSAFDDHLVGAIELPHQPNVVRGGHRLETDPSVIEWHAVRGDVRFESIYDEVV